MAGFAAADHPTDRNAIPALRKYTPAVSRRIPVAVLSYPLDLTDEELDEKVDNGLPWAVMGDRPGGPPSVIIPLDGIFSPESLE